MQNNINSYWIVRIFQLIKITLFVGVFITESYGFSYSQNENWKVLYLKNGIQVEGREAGSSVLKEFRGRCQIDASVLQILGVFNDDPHVGEWMKGTVEQRVLEAVPHSESDPILQDLYIYNRVALGMGISDRDAVLRVQIRVDKESKQLWIEFNSVVHPKQPFVAGVIRLPVVHGHWKLTPTADKRATQVEYQLYSDPGGWIPDWIANWVAKDVPYQTLLALRKQVQYRRYPAFEALLSKTQAYQDLLAP